MIDDQEDASLSWFEFPGAMRCYAPFEDRLDNRSRPIANRAQNWPTLKFRRSFSISKIFGETHIIFVKVMFIISK